MSRKETWVFYDGDCGLCGHAMRLVRHLDVDDRLAYETLGSEKAQKYNFEEGTMAVVQDEEIFLRSEAVRVMLKTAGGVALVGAVFLTLVPLFIRDRVYNWVARNRYRWFGGSCQINP